ncbi:hypothetical protein NPIL_482641 [Nephila pilipes]|uniref:Uncharacterized protein n=1 Tax=Nephila pilipes TaxID=299642 RepID=A0A8X6NUP7_NEPPI|nr:hypothetical protein NPIL_482641 [Nephila pilipes]
MADGMDCSLNTSSPQPAPAYIPDECSDMPNYDWALQTKRLFNIGWQREIRVARGVVSVSSSKKQALPL